MSESFDPYHAWLGIPPGERPPDYYCLLGLRRFEKRAEAIEAAADARVAALRPHQSGEQAQAAARLLAEVNAARLCLLNDNRRASYDIGLLQKVAATVAEQERGGDQVQVTAAEFLQLLADRDLVPADLLAAIRKQLSDAKSHVTARHVGKLLVDKGLLTPALVHRLLESAARAAAEAGATTAAPRAEPEPDELTLAPLDEEAKGIALLPSKKPQEATPRPSAVRAATPQGQEPTDSRRAADLPRDDEWRALSRDLAAGGPLDGLFSDPSFQATAGAPMLSALPQRGKKRFWASPGFLIGAAVVWVLLLVGAMLIVALNRPDEDEPETSGSKTAGVNSARAVSSTSSTAPAPERPLPARRKPTAPARPRSGHRG